MERRRLLGLLASGLAAAAGCATRSRGGDVTPADVPGTGSREETPVGPPDTATPPGTPGPSTPTETPESGGPFANLGSVVEHGTMDRTLALLRTEHRLDDGGVLEIEFVRTATDEGPARIAGEFRNDNGFENTFRLNALPLFDSVPSAWPGDEGDGEYTYRDELYLAPTANHDLAVATPGYELGDGGRWRLAGEISGPWLPERKRLDPGESVAVEYALLGHPEGTGFPAERYRFRGYGEASVTVSAWSTSSPGPETESRFEGAAVPALPDAESMAWYHEADAETTAYLRPSAERVELPARIEFALVNHGRAPLSGNPYYWKLHKLRDGEWFHVAPWGWPVPLSAVPPGGVETWTLRAFHGEAIPCEGGHEVGYLGGGRYAFEVGMGRGGETQAAFVDLAGGRVEVRPTDGVSATREGRTVVAISPRHENGEAPPATLVAERVESGGRRVIAEQVMRPRSRGLRNTLAFFEDGIERVELHTDARVVDRALGEGPSARLRFRGSSYTVGRERSV